MTSIRLSSIRSEAFKTGVIKLTGPRSITKGDITTYKISNYDAFTNYQASMQPGTVEIERENVFISLPEDEVATEGVLIISKDNVPRVIQIPFTSNTVILKPQILSPINGTIELGKNVTIQGSIIVSSPAGSLRHTATEWVISSDPEFILDVSNNTVNTGDLTRYNLNLSQYGTYYAKVRYMSDAKISEWSDIVQFTTVVTRT